MTEKRFRKMVACVKDAPAADSCGDPTAQIGVISWGSTYGAVLEAVQVVCAKGLPVAGLGPKMLWPLPDEQIKPFLRGKRLIIVPEVNYSGRFADLLRARYGCDVQKVNTYGGVPFNVSQIVDVIERCAEEVLLQHA